MLLACHPFEAILEIVFFLSLQLKQRMKVICVLFPNASFLFFEVYLFQDMQHSIKLPTCNIMPVYVACWGVCFDLRLSGGISPPSFQNRKVPLHWCYFYLPQDQVTLIKAFRQCLGMCGLKYLSTDGKHELMQGQCTFTCLCSADI